MLDRSYTPICRTSVLALLLLKADIFQDLHRYSTCNRDDNPNCSKDLTGRGNIVPLLIPKISKMPLTKLQDMAEKHRSWGKRLNASSFTLCQGLFHDGLEKSPRSREYLKWPASVKTNSFTEIVGLGERKILSRPARREKFEHLVSCTHESMKIQLQ